MAVQDLWKRIAVGVGGCIGLGLFLTAGSEWAVSAAAARVGQAPASKRSALDGVYTGEQARRGRDLYRKRCVLCHLDSGQGHQAAPVIPGESLENEGAPEAPAIAGDAFLKLWSGRSAGDLFQKLSTTMPVGSAGSLTPQEYVDVLAFMFELNKFPAGSQELPAPRDQLQLITIGRASGN